MGDMNAEIAAALTLILEKMGLSDTPEWRDLMRRVHPWMNAEQMETERVHRLRSRP